MLYWYLVNIEPQNLTYMVYDEDLGMNVETTILAPSNTVFNTIVYDGEAPFTPPTNMVLKSSENRYRIGSLFEDE